MRILIAPDSFKGSLSALRAAECMARGARAVFGRAECDLAPIADGGEGTVEALVAATGGTYRRERVRGPLGEPVEAAWGLLGGGRAAVVEMAAASGLPLLAADRRDPLRAGTYGTGELIRAALAALHANGTGTRGGCGTERRDGPVPAGGPGSGEPGRPGERAIGRAVRLVGNGPPGNGPRACLNHGTPEEPPTLIIGIGGSATNDAGAGALCALGARFLDADGRELEPGGAALSGLARIDCSNLDPLLAKTRLRVACDVDNPLTGERGASAVFGPQKGAGPAEVAVLDAALARFAEVARRTTGRDLADAPGAGAAGGLGAGLLFFTGARLEPGVDIVLEATRLEQRAARADLVLTGEGRSDVQTTYGKAPVGVAKAAKAHGRPVICISGALGEGAEALHAHGIDALCACVDDILSLEQCLEQAEPLLERATRRALRTLALGLNLHG